MYNESTKEYTFFYDAGAVVTITYDAEVLNGAVADTNAQAKNAVKITYETYDGTNSSVIPDPDPDDGEDPKAEETVQTRALTIQKTDYYENELTGATFKIHVGDTVIDVVKESDGVYHKADSDEIADKKTEKDGIVTDDGSGKIIIKGLDVDTAYSVEEVTAPEGYNKLESYATVETSGSGTDKDFVELVVYNTTGGTLPSTGGMGTTIFYVTGGILVVAALVVLITKKRMDAQN
jgi:LPXTG-motif cell wall-anchored protein